MVDLKNLSIDKKTLEALKIHMGKTDPIVDESVAKAYEKLADKLLDSKAKGAEIITLVQKEPLNNKIDLVQLAKANHLAISRLNNPTYENAHFDIDRNISLKGLGGEQAAALVNFTNATLQKNKEWSIDVTGAKDLSSCTAGPNVKIIGKLDVPCANTKIVFAQADLSGLTFGPKFTADLNMQLPKDPKKLPSINTSKLPTVDEYKNYLKDPEKHPINISQGEVYILEMMGNKQAKTLEDSRIPYRAPSDGGSNKGGGVGKPCDGTRGSSHARGAKRD